MDINAAFAAQSYGKAKPAVAPSEEGGNGFMKLADSFIGTLNNAEQTARMAMTGGADPHALVEALSASQMAVETTVTVRDKVVEAYQEILRMPV